MTSAQKVIKGCAIAFAIFIIIMIFNGILFALRVTGIFTTPSGDVNFEEQYENVYELDIDNSATNLIIKSGDKLKVEARNVSSSFSSKVSGGKLQIKEKANWGLFGNKVGEIEITLPHNLKLDNLKISAGAGKIEINDVTTSNLKIEQGAGLVKIQNSNFKKTDIDGGAGEINIQNSILEDLDLDSGVGKVSIEGEILGISKIDSGVGETNLLLGNRNNYSIYVEKGIGSIKIDSEEIKSETTNGNGENKIKIDGGIGAINVDFRG